WLFRAIVLVLGLGFPLVLLFAWAFELTPEGLKREKDVDRSQSIAPQTGQKLNYAIMTVMALALGYFTWDKFSASESGQESVVAAESQVIDKSIAVLPFINMSPDENNEYFSDGLSEELLNLLAKVDGLKVAARTSSFKFKNSDADIADIGKKLNVATVLEGSVRKAGNQARITAQLIKVDDGFHLWSETYDRSLDNIFEVQDEIARAIVDALKLPLLGQDAAPVASNATANFEAYDLYLLGRHHLKQVNETGFQNAVDYFTRAVASDPQYAPAWSGLAEAYMGLSDYGSMPAPEAYSLAEKAIEKARQIAPEAPETLIAQGSLMSYRGMGHETIPLFESAVKQNPNNVEALIPLTGALFEVDPQQSLELANKAWSLDPLSETTRKLLIDTLNQTGDKDGAIQKTREFLLDDPNNPGLFEALGLVYSSTGQHHLAIPNYEMTWKLRPGDVWPAMMIVRSYLYLGDLDSALLWKEKARERGANSRHFETIELVVQYHRGEWESMVAKYEQMLADGAESPVIRMYYGDALLRSGKPEQAERMYRSVSDVFGDEQAPVSENLQANAASRLLTLLPQGEERSQRLAALGRYTEELIEKRPWDIDTWALQASLAALQGDQHASFEAIEKAAGIGAMYAHGWEVSPALQKWKNDPEFRAILARMDQKAFEQRELLTASRPGP
ncbi:MAG TPA: hypothetical protein VKN35_04375, partial [Xanthomonadales bacterium]|nr:hypothetical protein [Xanthomonadales bacterium]